MKNRLKPVQGMLLLIDRKSDTGMIRWIEELDRREMPALVMVDGHTLNTNPALIERIDREETIDVGISYNDGPLWKETYDEMIAWTPQWLRLKKSSTRPKRDVLKMIMEHLNSKLSAITGKSMPVFSGKYFSYSEDTLEMAEEMGIQYILARGTQGEQAVFYQPEEFKPIIISVSNVPSKNLGTGSLCDISLKNRNEKPADFRNILFNLNADRFILVAQTHISGLEDEWWDIYQEFFNSGLVKWNKLDDFVTDPKILPNKDIPINREAQYMAFDLEKAVKSGELG